MREKLNNKEKRISGLDGLRFLSISTVILLHLFTFKANFGFSKYYFPVFELLGGIYAVQFFFVVSGFLLTFLLLDEIEKTGNVNVRNFYIRRILRIWPAYFLLIIVTLFIVNNISFFDIPGVTKEYLLHARKSNPLFLFILPHLPPHFAPTAPYIHHTYTIGIEEQFYILWGVLFYIFKRNIGWLLIALAIGMPFLNIGHGFLYQYTETHSSAPAFLVVLKQGLFYLQYSRISTFAIGSLFGYAYYYKKSWIYYFSTKPVQLLIYFLLFISLYFSIKPEYITYEYTALLMACVILIATNKKQSLINYSSAPLERMGRISYGIYLFHIFAIVLSIKLLSGIFHFTFLKFAQIILLCITTIALSVAFGWLSYNYFEVHFLKLKKAFDRVKKENEILP